MQDFVPLGTGNSRSLKSAVPAGTSWEQALEMLRNGTFPIDIGAVNDSGVAQKGTPLHRATLLSAETEALYPGLPENPVPDDVFAVLSSYSYVIKGEYIGTGTSGKLSNATSISFEKYPDVIFIGGYDDSELNKNSLGFGIIPCAFMIQNRSSASKEFLYAFVQGSLHLGGVRLYENTVSFYSSESAEYQFNKNGATYSYLAFFRNK